MLKKMKCIIVESPSFIHMCWIWNEDGKETNSWRANPYQKVKLTGIQIRYYQWNLQVTPFQVQVKEAS